MATSTLNMTATRKRRNPYTNVACQECKRRKVKCSGDNPCAGCQQVSALCLYERSTRFRAARRSSMVSSRSRDDGASSKRQGDEAPSAVPEEASVGLNAEFTPQPIRSGSSDYYFNLAHQLLSDSTPAGDPEGVASRHVPRMAHDLRKLIQDRSSCKAQPLLSIIGLPRWLEMLDFYEEEIGLLYPFLDVTDLRNQLRDISANLPGSDSTRQEIRLGHKLEEVLTLVLAVMAVLEEPDVSGLCDEFAEQVMINTWRRVHTGNIIDHDVNLSILMSIYYFMTDREPLAWRNIGTVVRMLQELGYHNSTDLQHRFKSRSARDRAKKVLWSAYMLDRRWSSGTGLPFAIHDSDIDYDIDFMDESLSSAYLKAMVAYCRIAAQVRDSALDMPSPNHAKDSARDLLDFKVNEWRRNLPSCLHFHPDMDFDPLQGTRGQYRLRLLLYLRANQMRIIIHRKSALRSGSDAIDTSSVNGMVEVAQDTIRVLAKLSQASNIYHAQQKTFNHFLESALSVLLLVTCRSKATADRSCAAEVQLALDVIERLSTSSSITRRLAEKLRCFATTTNDSRQQAGARNSLTRLGSKQPNRGVASTSGQDPVTNDTADIFKRPSAVSATHNSNAFDQSIGNSLDQVLFLPRSFEQRSPESQSSSNFRNGFTVTNQPLIPPIVPPDTMDPASSNPMTSLLYQGDSGVSEISPGTVGGEASLIDMPGGLELPTGEKWDGLLPDLGDFWLDYDKMITF